MEEPVRRAELHFDLNKLKEIGFVGVRRASAFMCLGLTPTVGEPPKNLSLNSAVNFQFLPTPLPEEMSLAIVAHYRTWLVGNALRELDLHCHLFLDEAWRIVQWLKLHNTQVKSDFKVSEISGDTNAASKLKKIYKALGVAPNADLVSQVWSITNARNCLTHNAGLVNSRYANKDEKQLKLAWVGPELRLRQGEKFTVITPEGSNFRAPDPSKEALIEMQFLEREKLFDIGIRIDLTPHELHEICFFYTRITETVVASLGDHFRSKGLVKEEEGVQGASNDSTAPG